jgi:hypothetical protein
MKTCTQCQQSFDIPADERAFLTKMPFQFGDVKVELPEPDACPDCLNQIRTAHRNERFLYQRKSDLTGKQIISIYSPEPPWGSPYTVYSYDEWHSGEWDPLQYGRDFDFNRPFFEQFSELQKAVPRLGLISLANENSPYTTGTAYCKNCHLINSSENCEDCYYGKLLQGCKDSVDCTYLYDSELCYQCFSVYNSYNCVFLSNSSNCSDCWFSENLSGCRNCFLCTNLNNKEYYFMNQPLAKEEYERRVKEFVGSHRNFEKAKEILAKLKRERIHKYSNIVSSENCSGDYIKNSQNCHNVYDLTDSQDCRNVWVGINIKDNYECSNMYLKQELNYQALGTIETYHVAYSIYTFHSQNILYSDHTFSCQDLFGCVGLKNKKYCIFNKQYSKEEYEGLVPKIIEHMKQARIPDGQAGEWGQFFPARFSPHGYNESLANEYYPMSREDVLSHGWNWHEDIERGQYQGPHVEIPDHIDEVSDAIVDQILTCEKSGKPYKVMKQELDFYRKLRLPIPRRSFEQRYVDRLALRNQRRLWDRECMSCGKAIQSTYAPDRPEKIYCEKCYLDAVY